MYPQSRRKFLRMVGLSSAAVAAAACQPKVVEVEKVVTQEVEKIVEKVVKETVIVEGTPQIVEKIVTVQPAQPFEGVALRVGHWWGESFNPVGEGFMERYPGIDFAMEPAPWDGYHDKLFTQLAAGTGQDVNFIDAGQFFKFFAAKASLPLNDYFDRDAIDQAKFAIDPAVDSGVNGIIYAVPQWHPDSPNIWGERRPDGCCGRCRAGLRYRSVQHLEVGRLCGGSQGHDQDRLQGQRRAVGQQLFYERLLGSASRHGMVEWWRVLR